ncbi:cytochrome P450 [Telluria aromaticivorans]|uniref:Cytochrome P450 n=1 Tax=Telluria aromaticivorans TaxID=2725995 RepID=A0A7Y2NYN4_9BURK|nr:cytochrome P450 [Telluria aromaticivorans]NNG22243.1 cytochrome P450 [Telluria aromaticivorans]
MNTPSPAQCPFRAGGQPPAPVRHPVGAWPPGPPSGLTGWSLLARMARDLPAALARWRQDYGDLVHLRMWPEHQLVVADPQLVRELLVTHHEALIRWERGIGIFSYLQGNSVLIAEAPQWAAKRHALQPAFAPKAVKAFVPTIAAAAGKAMEAWQAAAAVPIESHLTALTMDVIMRMMFSSEIGDEARSMEAAVHAALVEGNAEMFWPASWPDWMPWKRRKRKVRAQLTGLVERQVQSRLALPLDAWPADLLSRLLELHRADGQAWPLDAVRDECMTAFLAGHETTAASLTWWAWCMASNPAAQEEARQEVASVLQGRTPGDEDLPALGYLAQTLDETMRLYPAAPVLMSRRSTREITLGGWTVPTGTMFMIPVFLMHQDPRWFPEPQAFRPGRFAADAPAIPRGAFMPFGTGPRVCLGQHLALMEMTVVAAMLLQRFVLSVPAGQAAPQPVLNISMRPGTPLCLALASSAA